MAQTQVTTTTTRKKNLLQKIWHWFAFSIKKGVEDPIGNLVGTFGIWCIGLGLISVLGFIAYLALGSTHQTWALPSARDLGESAANGARSLLRGNDQTSNRINPENDSIYETETETTQGNDGAGGEPE